VIRQRIRQKMEFVVADLVNSGSPSDDELQAWFDARREDYRIDASFDLRQVYVDPSKHGDELPAVLEDLHTKLRSLANPDLAHPLGDRILLDFYFADMDEMALRTTFGDKLAAAWTELPRDQWSGPVESAYGLHLVYLSERSEARLPELAEIRRIVLRDYEYHQHNASRLQLREEILGRYEVSIEWPQAAGPRQAAQP
jgi:hypothetical protein